MRKKVAILVSGGFSLFICCVSLAIYWDGYYLPGKLCRPIEYPGGKQVTEVFRDSTSDSLASVLAFYDERLQIHPLPRDVGQWAREEIENSQYLYSCYGVDINRLTGETGCVYVSREDGKTIIEAELLRGMGANVPCSRKEN